MRARWIVGVLALVVAGAVGFRARVSPAPGTAVLVAETPPRVVSGPGWVAPWVSRTVIDSCRTVRLEQANDAAYRLFDAEGRELTAEVTASACGSWRVWERIVAAVALHNLDETLAGVLQGELRTLLAAERGDTAGTDLAPRLEAALERNPAASGLAWRVETIHVTPAAGEADRAARSLAASTARRILLIGVDGADPEILERLAAAGELPHFRRLMERGIYARLRSITPLLSPLIWTTMATGVSPERHGILDFVKRTESGALLPVESTDRQVPALWNHLSAFGKRTAMVGWLATYPAEDILGAIITDRFGFLPFHAGAGDDPAAPGMVWPPDLLDGALERRVAPETLSPELLRAFVSVPAETLAASLAPGFRRGELVNNLAHTLGAALTADAEARWLWESTRPDVGLFYFELVDAVGHLFMPYAPPRLPWIEAADVARYGDAVDAAYRLQDEILGRLTALADDSTLIVVVSDHGFKSGEARPRESSVMEGAAAARWHNPDGIVILAGPGVRTGAALDAPRVHDVMPTLAAYAGVAPPAGLEGRTWTEAFAIPLPSPLGGAGSDTAASAGSNSPSSATGLNNLGLRQMASGQIPEAIRSFEEAKALDPEALSIRNNLAQAWQAAGDPARAARELDALLERHPDYALGWMNLGLARLALGDGGGAAAALERAADLEPRDPRILRNLGFACLEAARPGDAEPVFRRALELEDAAAARFGLGVALLQTGRAAEGRVELQRALELEPGHAGARAALESLGPGE